MSEIERVNVNTIAADCFRTLEDTMHAVRKKEIEDYMRGMMDGVAMLRDAIHRHNDRNETKVGVK
jgi:hypothetical protein